MNKWFGIGRLTKDPAVMNKAETKIARYSLAVDRRSKDKQADFINIVAFGRNADFAELYLHKGTKIAVEGRIQTGSYKNKNGDTVYTFDIIADSQEFCESKKAQEDAYHEQQATVDGFIAVPEGMESELPFV